MIDGSYIHSIADITVPVLTLYHEARGEIDNGVTAVAHVIINRAIIDLHDDGKPDWWGETLSEVCLKNWQFSCWNGVDRKTIKSRNLLKHNFQHKRILSLFVSAMQSDVDPTDGATHYMTIARRKKGWPRSWGPVREPCKEIGNHLFYNNIET